ncbi:thiol reductant ABC exporter subunit CydC [Corynebacterium lactis]|uniref:ABC transporter permease n=1 Tax=Corynebacterium lactis RW2-5 TaxID=1408189 RepID=A0A0K2H214_9CORY|nr:thiol reductant ABC exporter subunit CydC [Corynebacterium lactis]ALA67983.1 ABC transporter permease [Corynebacterium lactis RW2-5]
MNGLRRPAGTGPDAGVLRSLRGLIGLRELLWPVFAGTVTLLSALSLTVVSAWLITRSWQMPPLMEITVAVTSVRALGISRSVFRYIDRLAAHHVALTAAERSRLALWRNLSGKPQVAGCGRGELAGLLGTDVDTLANVVVRFVIPTLIAATTSILAVCFAAVLSVPSAAVLAVGLAVAGMAAPYLIYRTTVAGVDPRARALTDTASAIESVLVDSAGLRIRGQLDEAIAAATRSTTAVARIDRHTGNAAGRASALATAASTLCAVATVGIAAYLMGTAHSPEWLTVLVLIPLAAFESVAALPAGAQTLARSRLSLITLADAPSTGAVGPSGATIPADLPLELAAPLLRVHDLETAHGNLGPWNFELPFGEYKEITAPSGSGKTTLLKTLAGAISPLSGRVEIVADSRPLPPVPEVVRFVAEDEHIFATTVRDNIAVGNPKATAGEIAEVTTALGLAEWVSRLPDGLDTVLADGADSLSGGQRRRLILARALVSTAPILLLDEPTEHIDEASEAILQLLRDGCAHGTLPGARGRRSVVVVRHPRQVRQ